MLSDLNEILTLETYAKNINIYQLKQTKKSLNYFFCEVVIFLTTYIYTSKKLS